MKWINILDGLPTENGEYLIQEKYWNPILNGKPTKDAVERERFELVIFDGKKFNRWDTELQTYILVSGFDIQYYMKIRSPLN